MFSWLMTLKVNPVECQKLFPHGMTQQSTFQVKVPNQFEANITLTGSSGIELHNQFGHQIEHALNLAAGRSTPNLNNFLSN